MRNVLIASMATAALLAAACTQSSHISRSAFTGVVIGAQVATVISERIKLASNKQ